MGIEELLLDRAREEGKEEGYREVAYTVAKNLILEFNDLPNDKIANVVKMPVAFVEKIRTEINK